MSTFLGATVTENGLNRAAAESAEEHLLNPERLWALCTVTGDFRPISVLLEGSDKVLIEKRWLGAVREAIAIAERERIDGIIKALGANGGEDERVDYRLRTGAVPATGNAA